MGIALLSLVDLFTPFQSLAHRWMPSRRDRAAGGLRYVGIRPSGGSGQPPSRPVDASQPARPLRIVHSAKSKARLVISGRMSDVCAELDRLAAIEAATTANGRGRLH